MNGGLGLAAQLRDIRGLDPISWWPLAPGWWILIGGLLVLIIGLTLWIRHLRKYPPGGWNKAARQQLMALRRRQRELGPKTVAAELSELLKRIALARFGRQGFAALSGEDWLQWLEAHDPNNFKWQEKGRLLLELPYAPEGREADPKRLDALIGAALKLAAHSREDASRRRRRRRTADV